MSNIDIELEYSTQSSNTTLVVLKYNWRRFILPLAEFFCWVGSLKYTWQVCVYVGDPIRFWVRRGTTVIAKVPIDLEQENNILEAWGQK